MAARKITFEEKTITISPEVSGETDNVTLLNVVDTGSAIKAKLRVMMISFEKTLWQGASYKPLAEWTQLEIDNKIIDVL